MRKIPAAILVLLLCLGLTACTPVAEVTASPEPTATPTAEPTPIPTPEPTPAPTPLPTEPAHEWSGEGYSYTSEALGIRIEFPPQWQWYFTFEEDQVKDFLYYDTNEDGWGGVAEESTTVLYLMPKYTSKELPEGQWFARIFWKPKGTSDIDSANWGSSVKLWESEEGRYICWMNRMPQLLMEDDTIASKIETLLTCAMYESVQNGIIDGRWEIEVLEK